MKRGSTRKSGERRKKARGTPRTAKSSIQPSKLRASPASEVIRERKSLQEASTGVPQKASQEVSKEACQHCGRNLKASERALFVEEEIGRIFCSEDCIAGFFSPEIERLEKEYFRRLSANDLSAGEREALAHLRWITLQEPDEVWREKTLSGDYRYTLISEFQPGDKKVWSISICLFLRGEPSFLYLAFPTRNTAMVNQYRRGERIQWEKAQGSDPKKSALDGTPRESGVASAELLTDRLADEWTEDETYRAQMNLERREDDIPPSEYSSHENCMDETLEGPDEVWSMKVGGDDSLRLFHFIRHYPKEKPGMWYLIVARETENDEQIEILDAFPTRDSALVDRYRRGEREYGAENQAEAASTTRVVH